MPQEYSYNWNNYDKDLLLDFNHFLKKINQRACIQYGYIDEVYESKNRHGKEDFGLGIDVEYFHPSITLDDRMNFIATRIIPETQGFNTLGNTLISHFYGARGVHQVITRKDDEFIDFERIADRDTSYIGQMRFAMNMSIDEGKPVWGTTELHTSIQTAGRNYCRELYEKPEMKFHPFDVCEWVASFRDNRVYEDLLKAEHIQDAYKILTRQRGIGEYYGFHGAASTSVIPFLKYHHDQRFVAPGPGAAYTIGLLWPEAPRKLYAEAVYFLRENSDEIGLTRDVDFHEKTHNINNLFTFSQNSLKYYGTEVLCCQFGIYLQIRDDQKACERRKVARLCEIKKPSLEKFF